LAARKSPSKGGKPDKLMRHALMLELHREAKQADGKVTKRLRLVARKLVERAEQGDVPAIKEIFDRVDGRVPQPQHVSGPEGEPINVLQRLLKEIANLKLVPRLPATIYLLAPPLTGHAGRGAHCG
jgi:hypothetical protein